MSSNAVGRLWEAALRLRGWRLWAVVFLLTAAVYVPTATYDLRQSFDTFNTAVQARQFAISGTPSVDEIEYPPDAEFTQVREGRHGLVTSRHPGPVLAGVMGYTLARPFLGDAISNTQYREVPSWPAGLTAALIAAGSMATVALALSRMDGVPQTVALGSTAALAFGTSTWSVAANALWPHTVTQLGLAVAILGLVRGGTLRAGTGFAIAILARTHTAAIAAGAGLGLGVDQRRVRPVVIVGLLSTLGLASAVLYGVWMYGGEPSVTVGRGEVVDLITHGGRNDTIWGALGSQVLLYVHPLRGLLPTAPFLVPLILSLPAVWRRAPHWVRGMALGGVLQLVVQGTINVYSGGDAFFGSRLTLEILTATAPLWCLAYVAAADRPRVRDWTHAGVFVAVCMHLLGATVLRLGV